MLSALVDRFDESANRLRDDVVEYKVASGYSEDSRKRQSKS
jgi:hypothetical protein